jgi:hypothetical protein
MVYVSAIEAAGGNTRNVGAIKANVSQFTIAELRQFTYIPLIVPERLKHPNER